MAAARDLNARLFAHAGEGLFGDAVHADQELVVVESMKMESPVAAPRAGVVEAVLVAEGEAVQEGQALLLVKTA